MFPHCNTATKAEGGGGEGGEKGGGREGRRGGGGREGRRGGGKGNVKAAYMYTAHTLNYCPTVKDFCIRDIINDKHHYEAVLHFA